MRRLLKSATDGQEQRERLSGKGRPYRSVCCGRGAARYQGRGSERRGPGGANAKPVPRIVINGVRMLDWDHVSRSVQHLAGRDPEARGKVRVKIHCPADVPFGWVHACMASCVKAGIWRLSFTEPLPPPGNDDEW